MHKKSTTIVVFVIFLTLALVVYVIGRIPMLGPLEGIGTFFLKPFAAISFMSSHGSYSESEKKLLEENAMLRKKLIEENRLLAENNALRDQFKLNKPSNEFLLPAHVIGAPGFIPGVSAPEFFIINVGEKDGIKKNDIAVFQNNLIGSVQRVSYSLSVVIPLNELRESFLVKTVNTQASGLFVQSGGDMRMEGVVLSEKLQKDDMVVTAAGVDASGGGFAPDIVVGKIVSIEKEPSALFQSAKIRSLVDFAKIHMLFIYRYQK